jgi:GxxExxY protein
MLLHEELTRQIYGAAIEVHRELGPGLLESAYEECLCREFELRRIPFRRQLELPIIYKGLQLSCGYRIDVLVDDAVILEIKSVEATLPIHEAQLLTYLRLSQKRVGLLMNFNSLLMKDGIARLVL